MLTSGTFTLVLRGIANMSAVRSKICGITRIDDALAAVAAGADAIGFVFYAPSPRSVTPEQAKKLLKHVPAYVQTVGLFVNATGNEIEQVLKTVPLDLLQFHGDETDNTFVTTELGFEFSNECRIGLEFKELIKPC